MSENPINVLLVEDNPGDARLLHEHLSVESGGGFRIIDLCRLAEALELLRRESGFHVVLLDLMLPDSRGLDTLSRLYAEAREIPIIVLTGADDGELGIAAVKAGAQDYIVKGQFNPDLLVRAIRYAIERKQVVKNLRRAKEEAEFANRAKTDFLANMNHELRTPLNAIIGFSELILVGTFGPMVHPQYDEYVKYINEAGQHLLKVVNDILDLSKIEAGKAALRIEEIDVGEAVESVQRILKLRAEQAGVCMRTAIPRDLPLLVADACKFKQILLNILSNAIKFSPPGSTVTLDTFAEGDGSLVLRVADTGIGIAPEDVAKAMAAFSQVDSHLNRKYEGTGLGLPLTKALVELHGGTFELNSAVGIGTTVTIRLPKTAAAARPPSYRPAARAG